MAGVWTVEIVDQLRALAAQGYSATQAALHFDGMTRNAAVGLAFRKGFHFLGTGGGSNHKSAKAPKDPTIRLPPRTYLKCAEVKAEEQPVPSIRVTLMELEPWMCKWPLGDPRHESFRYCGAKRHEEYPYCSNCCRIAYESPESRHADAQKQAGQNRFVHPSLRIW